MEDDPQFFLMEDGLIFFGLKTPSDIFNFNPIRPKTTFFFLMEDDPNCFQMDDNLNIFVNGRQPKLF